MYALHTKMTLINFLFVRLLFISLILLQWFGSLTQCLIEVLKMDILAMFADLRGKTCSLLPYV